MQKLLIKDEIKMSIYTFQDSRDEIEVQIDQLEWQNDEN